MARIIVGSKEDQDEISNLKERIAEADSWALKISIISGAISGVVAYCIARLTMAPKAPLKKDDDDNFGDDDNDDGGDDNDDEGNEDINRIVKYCSGEDTPINSDPENQKVDEQESDDDEGEGTWKNSGDGSDDDDDSQDKKVPTGDFATKLKKHEDDDPDDSSSGGGKPYGNVPFKDNVSEGEGLGSSESCDDGAGSNSSGGGQQRSQANFSSQENPGDLSVEYNNLLLDAGLSVKLESVSLNFVGEFDITNNMLDGLLCS
ncbi:MAG: hypothetical protein N4A31_06540 [Rickettsiales bacterium]|jgi:hypothetical protein|nr:hypothetical protein [Rickettsiales bacterium]